MSTIVKTDAIVLKSMKYRETSKIVTFYTREFGKMSGLVKGARAAKSKFSGLALEPMSLVSTVVYKKEGRELQTVAQCDLIKAYRRILANLETMSVGLAIVELVDMIAHEEERNVPLFVLIVSSLDAVDAATKNPSNVLYSFELHLMSILGFKPSFGACISCGRSVQRSAGKKGIVQFHLSKGGLLCGDCALVPGHKVSLSEQAVDVLGLLLRAENAAEVVEVAIDKSSREEIESFLWTYLRFHVTGIRPLRSGKVFSKILTSA